MSKKKRKGLVNRPTEEKAWANLEMIAQKKRLGLGEYLLRCLAKAGIVRKRRDRIVEIRVPKFDPSVLVVERSLWMMPHFYETDAQGYDPDADMES